MRTSEVLNTAADLIERDGWHQGGYGARGGWQHDAPSCALGALNRAADGIDLDATSVLSNHVGGSVIAWNDAPERTAAEVIEALRAAALIESTKEQSAAEATYAENLAVTA